MLYDKSADDNKNVIHIEILSKYLSKGEKEKIDSILNDNNLEIKYHDYEPKASIFDAISLFFSDNLMYIILTSIISAAAYDALKFTILRLLKTIKKVRLFSSNSITNKIIKKKGTEIVLHFNNIINVNVIISNKINKKINLEYIDNFFAKIKELNKLHENNVEAKEIYIIEYDKKTKSMRTITLTDYAKEQYKIQESKKKKKKALK